MHSCSDGVSIDCAGGAIQYLLMLILSSWSVADQMWQNWKSWWSQLLFSLIWKQLCHLFVYCCGLFHFSVFNNNARTTIKRSSCTVCLHPGIEGKCNAYCWNSLISCTQLCYRIFLFVLNFHFIRINCVRIWLWTSLVQNTSARQSSVCTSQIFLLHGSPSFWR